MPRFFGGNLVNCFDASSLRVLISHHLLNPVAGRIDECLDQARLLDQDDCTILSVRGLRRVDELFSKYDQMKKQNQLWIDDDDDDDEPKRERIARMAVTTMTMRRTEWTDSFRFF